MIVLNRPPTQDEMQYASDILHGRRKWDVRIIVGFALLGAILGILVGFSNAQANNEPIDIGFTLICMGFCAAALGMAAALIMNAIRTIGAMCKAYLLDDFSLSICYRCSNGWALSHFCCSILYAWPPSSFYSVLHDYGQR